MLTQKDARFNIERLLTNRRGKISSSNILKLLVVFGIAIFFQCCTLLLTKDYILYNNISSTTFLFIAFSLTSILSIIRQKTWKYLSYLNPKRIPIIVFQAILYSLSFLCLIHGITSNGILQYYSLINVIQIFNIFSNANKLCSNSTTKSMVKKKVSSSWMAKLQLLLSIISFLIGIYIFCMENSFGVLSLTLYHLISYLREQHHHSAHAQHKSFKRIEPLGLLLSAFIVLSLSIFSSFNITNLAFPHHEHQYDLQEKFANDERVFMHHSANHDIDTSAKITHRLLLADDDDNDDVYEQKMKELEQLADIDNNQKDDTANADHIKQDNTKPSIGFIQYSIWSMIIYILFVLFFILLNPHLSYLQIRIYELVFVNQTLNNIIKYNPNQTKQQQQQQFADSNKPIADILKLTSNTNDNDNHDHHGDNDANKHSVQLAPKWNKLVFFYQLLSMQYIGIISFIILSIFRSNMNKSRIMLFAAFLMFIGSECGIRCGMKWQLSFHPNWFNKILYFLFGSMVISKPLIKDSHHHGHHHRHRHHSASWIVKILANIPSFIQHIRETQTSRRIFIFLTMNFLFMFVEFIYGYLSNSLGLISDACHMLFDCIALMIGLMASYLGSPHATNSSLFSKDDIWMNQNRYSYGYGKIKVLSGFINAIFLIYIGISVLIESFERIIHPPHIHTDQLLIVSVLGLFVNLIGLFFFHDAHMAGHNETGGCSHHGHGHHDHHHHGHDHHDHNIRGIFLHILADTLGSVGVIISSLLIYFFDLTIFDALCSVFIAILIFLTVYPLIKSTSKILLQETPNYILSSLRNELSTVLSSVHGIIGYREAHFWEYEPGELIGSIHIQIDEHSDEQQLLSQIHDILKQRFGFKNEKHLTIQIEKQSYLDKCDPIHHSVYSNIIQIQRRKSSASKQRNLKHHHHDHHDHHHGHHHPHHGHHDNHQHHNHHDHDHHETGGCTHHHDNNLSDNSNSSFIKISS